MKLQIRSVTLETLRMLFEIIKIEEDKDILGIV